MIMWFIFFSLLTTTCFLFSTCAAWGGGVADWTQGAVDGREQTDLFTWGIIYAHIPVQWLLRLNTSSWDYFPRFSPNPPKLCLLKSSSKRAAVSLHETLSSLKPAERAALWTRFCRRMNSHNKMHSFGFAYVPHKKISYEWILMSVCWQSGFVKWGSSFIQMTSLFVSGS